MMGVIAKWRITILNRDRQDMAFFINEDYYSNLLRDLAKFDFGDDVISI